MPSNNYFSPRTVDGNKFSGGFVATEPEQPQPTQPAPPPRLALDKALEVLAAVTIQPELRDELILQLRDIGEQANSLLERNHSARLEDLRQQHRRVVAECRKQRELIDKLVTRIGSRDAAVRDAGQKCSACRVRLLTAQRDPAVSPENYPSEQQKQDHNLLLHKLREQLAEAEKAERSENGAQQGLATELREAQQVMGKLSERELLLRNALAGQATRDKETGLWTTPEAVR